MTTRSLPAFGVPIYGANGLALDTEGRLIVAENTMRRVTSVESDGTVTPIAEEFEGTTLNQPNDIVVRSDGTIYFTDPYYGDATTDLDFHGVFRIAPDGSLTAAVSRCSHRATQRDSAVARREPALRHRVGCQPGVGLRRR